MLNQIESELRVPAGRTGEDVEPRRKPTRPVCSGDESRCLSTTESRVDTDSNRLFTTGTGGRAIQLVRAGI